MEGAGFQCLVPRDCSAHIITAFLYPAHSLFNFEQFYTQLSEKGTFNIRLHELEYSTSVILFTELFNIENYAFQKPLNP
jgi:hypothetical protein